MNIGYYLLKLASVQKWPKTSFDLPLYQTHRGYWNFQVNKQNTIESLQMAFERGSKMSECDVRSTADNQVVLFHDDFIIGNDNEKKFINLLTLSELRKIAESLQINVPTLDEVLTSKNITPYLNIEIKSNHFVNDKTERLIKKIIVKHNAENRILFSSFNPITILKLTQLCPNVPRALLVSGEINERNSIWLRDLWFVPLLQIHMLNLQDEMLTDNFIEKLINLQIPFAAWTINNSIRAQELIAKGCKSIISDQLIQ
jgi:glycerophosphoryl diester phosphodiesterase